MKKTLLVTVLALALVFAFASVAMAYGPFNLEQNGGSDGSYYGYLSWTVAQSTSSADTSTPHGNYTTSTYKCAVCHSAHKADAGGKVLTAWPGLGSNTSNTAPYESCTWCHGTSSPLFALSRISMGTTLAPHGYCGRCHSRSVHGADGSVYPVLRARMINTNADASIAAELANGTNDMVLADFNDASSMKGLTLGTGYLCGNSSCHDSNSGGDDVAFPVNESGATPYQSATQVGTVTGHRVMAMNTDTWNNGTGTAFSGEYGVYYSSGYTGSAVFGGPVAFNPVANASASGCKSCHDITLPDGTVAFPHSYVTTQAVPAENKGVGTSYIWLTTAGDADDARTGSWKTTSGSGDAAAGTVDGLCLKCHLGGDRTEGVGETF